MNERHVHAWPVAACIVAMTVFTPTSAIAEPKCDLGRAIALERQAQSKFRSEDPRALSASVDFQRAAGELVRCALSPNPPTPRWKLFAAAQIDEQQSIRMDVLNGAVGDPDALNYRTATMHRLDAAVYRDTGAPPSVKAAALSQWDEWCLGSTPQFQRSYERKKCHEFLATLTRSNAYLQEFVVFADVFTPSRRAASATSPRDASHAVRPPAQVAARGPAACARPHVPARVVQTVEPQTPDVAQQQGIQGTVNVEVSLDEQSRVVAMSVISSPSAVLNPAALAAARATVFQTEIRNCKPVAEKFVFAVSFNAE
jgi:TonB family protein